MKYDLSNLYTAVIIITMFLLAYLVTIPRKKKVVAYKPARPVLPPVMAIMNMTSIIDNALCKEDMAPLEGLKQDFRDEYKDVFTDNEIKKICFRITDLQRKRMMELWSESNHLVNLVSC